MKIVNGPARVALYLRAETLVHAATQAALLQQVVDNEPGWRIVAVFGDLASAVADRPGRDGAMNTARAGFDVLLVMSLDRLTRNTDELGELIHQLTAAKVILCTAHRPHGPHSDMDIVAVDDFQVAVYRELAGSPRPVRALPAEPGPAGDAQ